MIYAGLASLSEGCPPDRGRLHTCYSPVRRSPARKASFPPAAPRLACVKPAASVHPEPGSNSPLSVSCFFLFKILFGSPIRENQAPYCVCLDLRHILQVGIDTETFLIELSLYLSQPDTSLKCPAACLGSKMSLCLSHPGFYVLQHLFPVCGCKVITIFYSLQIFSKKFLVIFAMELLMS